MGEDGSAVVDDLRHHRFVFRQDGIDAQLVYRTDGDRLRLVHTEEPDVAFRGDVGSRLVQAALERAVANGEVLVPWCPGARKWLTDRPDLSGRVGIDWYRSAGAEGTDSCAGITSPTPESEKAASGG